MSITFTDSEIKLMTSAWLCIDGGTGIPKIDYEKLAAQTGFTKGSASVLWGKLKRKLEAASVGGEDGDGTPVPAVTPKKTPKKRTAKEAGATDGTPKKRGRKSKAEIAAAAAADAAKEENEDDEEGKAIIKKQEDSEDGVDKLLPDAKEFSAMNGAGLIGADSDDEA